MYCCSSENLLGLIPEMQSPKTGNSHEWCTDSSKAQTPCPWASLAALLPQLPGHWLRHSWEPLHAMVRAKNNLDNCHNNEKDEADDDRIGADGDDKIEEEGETK